MSLTDRDRVTTPPPGAPTSPAADDAGGPNAPRGHKALLALIAVLVVVSLALIVFGLTHKTATSTQAVAEPLPTTPAASQTPTSSPTPVDPREQAVQGAESAYKAYVAAYARAANAGGSDTIPPYLAALVEGQAAKNVLGDMRRDKAGGFAGTGRTKVTVRTDRLSADVSAKATPTATLQSCIDQTEVTVTKNGKVYPGKPVYVRELATMRRVAGVWKLSNYTDELWTNGDCVNAVGSEAQ